MSGLPHLHGRQHVQHAQSSSLQCDTKHPTNDRLNSTNSGQHSNHASESQSSTVPASTAVEPASEYTLHGASSRASNPTSPIDVVSHSRELSGAGYPTTRSRSSPDRSQMRPRYTQITIGDRPERNQAESKRSVTNVHNNDSTAVPKPPSPSGIAAGHKRTATGFIKPLVEDQPYSSSTIVSERRRSKSISSATHGNRIAALSVHLRTRLSYAAAKIEASRRSQGSQNKLPLDLLHNDRSSSTPATDPFERIGRGGESQELIEPSSPGAITSLSVPDTLPKSHLYSHNNPMRSSPTARSEDSAPSLKSDPRKSRTPLSSFSRFARLAAPADIIPRSDSSGRRRPNPNDPSSQAQNFPYPRHRRHHSQQSISTIKRNSSSETVLVPETPPLRPLPYNGLSSQQSHSQNSSMEQDAIETLLFMSSPGHSGYCSNSQPSRSQPNHTHSSITSTQTKHSAPGSQDTHIVVNTAPPTGYRDSGVGLEAQAGDEIDRLLDQMDSDSEDENNYPSGHSNSISTRSTPRGGS
ncbi:hypothetical protein BDV38DRAFT_240789 [Aspergillus pseudotamarii]|uniref:Uncharacterized protein n=1 Tax=Aspergillus pseudotamarii TaxID=132259 RepID=A0A5N6T1M0_ASPPS|nr:uncharacterized protein BDV38DRAFT_240789 [Aspergillus pseudotamarii]KAE8139994.1 hypothetical protein BDV38DRAFT_240789 [Aspergillus pseudotamarii]